jgi:predicted lipoprotein with Yx(FWY)xxD motif
MSTRTALTRITRASRQRAGHRSTALSAVAAVAVVTLSACASSSTPASGSGTGALLATASTSLGTILVDGHDKAVYTFGADSPGHSTCTATCLQYWPIVAAPAALPASLSGVTAQLGELTRADGSKQLTVNGWPVYTYAADTSGGTASGQGQNLSGGQWWVVSASGTAIKTSAAPSSSPSPTSTPTSTPTPTPSASKSSGGGSWA